MLHTECLMKEVKKVMHVQSVSHWAPANIGPYSQVVQVGHFLILQSRTSKSFLGFALRWPTKNASDYN